MSLATLNGSRVTSCRVQIPAWGAWWAEVETDRTDLITGSATLVVDDLALVGTVVSSGAYEARQRFRIVGGAGGWGRSVRSRSYTNDAGVKLATVIGDAARDCGETLGAVPAGITGTAYVRAEGPASRVLEELVPRGWYVDAAGITQIGRRPTKAFAAAGVTRTAEDFAHGRLELAPQSLVGLVPGVVVDGLEAVDVEHVLEGGALRTTLWGRGIADTSRLPEAMRRFVEVFTAHHRFFAPWEYRVVQRSGERLDLQIVRVSSGMPDLRNVRVRGGLSGAKARPKLGSLVLVSFVDGDPARPVVTAFDDPEGPGAVADEIFAQAGTTGASPTEHATSAEAVVLFVYRLLAQFATPLGGAAVVAGAIGTALTAMAGGSTASLDSIDSDAGVPAGTAKAAIDALLAAKVANTNGKVPGIGWPKVRGG